MELNESQKTIVAQWVNAGATLSEVQTRIAEEFGIKLTYMDVRFLVDDLDLELQDKNAPAPQAEAPVNASAVPAEAAPPQSNPYSVADEDEVPSGTPAADAAAAETNKVSVTVDPVQKPGVIVGGGIRFSDGVRGRWLIDSTGRLGLDGLPAGYRPSQQDIAEVQVLLSQELRKLGYQ